MALNQRNVWECRLLMTNVDICRYRWVTTQFTIFSWGFYSHPSIDSRRATMRTRRMIIPEKLGMISHPKYDWSLVTSDKWLILIQSKDTVLFFSQKITPSWLNTLIILHDQTYPLSGDTNYCNYTYHIPNIPKKHNPNTIQLPTDRPIIPIIIPYP